MRKLISFFILALFTVNVLLPNTAIQSTQDPLYIYPVIKETVSPYLYLSAKGLNDEEKEQVESLTDVKGRGVIARTSDMDRIAARMLLASWFERSREQLAKLDIPANNKLLFKALINAIDREYPNTIFLKNALTQEYKTGYADRTQGRPEFNSLRSENLLFADFKPLMAAGAIKAEKDTPVLLVDLDYCLTDAPDEEMSSDMEFRLGELLQDGWALGIVSQKDMEGLSERELGVLNEIEKECDRRNLDTQLYMRKRVDLFCLNGRQRVHKEGDEYFGKDLTGTNVDNPIGAPIQHYHAKGHKKIVLVSSDLDVLQEANRLAHTGITEKDFMLRAVLVTPKSAKAIDAGVLPKEITYVGQGAKTLGKFMDKGCLLDLVHARSEMPHLAIPALTATERSDLLQMERLLKQRLENLIPHKPYQNNIPKGYSYYEELPKGYSELAIFIIARESSEQNIRLACKKLEKCGQRPVIDLFSDLAREIEVDKSYKVLVDRLKIAVNELTRLREGAGAVQQPVLPTAKLDFKENDLRQRQLQNSFDAETEAASPIEAAEIVIGEFKTLLERVLGAIQKTPVAVYIPQRFNLTKDQKFVLDRIMEKVGSNLELIPYASLDSLRPTDKPFAILAFSSELERFRDAPGLMDEKTEGILKNAAILPVSDRGVLGKFTSNAAIEIIETGIFLALAKDAQAKNGGELDEANQAYVTLKRALELLKGAKLNSTDMLSLLQASPIYKGVSAILRRIADLINNLLITRPMENLTEKAAEEVSLTRKIYYSL